MASLADINSNLKISNYVAPTQGRGNSPGNAGYIVLSDGRMLPIGAMSGGGASTSPMNQAGILTQLAGIKAGTGLNQALAGPDQGMALRAHIANYAPQYAGIKTYGDLLSKLFPDFAFNQNAAPSTPTQPPSSPSANSPSGLSPLQDAIMNPSANPNLPVTDHPLAALMQPDPSKLTPEQKAQVAAQNNYDMMAVEPPPAGGMPSPNSLYTPFTYAQGGLAPLNTVNRQYFPQEMRYFYNYGRMPEYRFFTNT